MDEIEQIDKDIKILIVDELLDVVEEVRQSLLQLGFSNVEQASDGAEALKRLQKGDYQFVIADWSLPTVAGIDLLKAVRADDSLKNLPFVMLASQDDCENLVEAIREGVSNFLIRPFDKEDMLSRLEVVFKVE